MALTLSAPVPVTVGGKRGKIVTIAFDSSYATGGEALTAADFGFISSVDNVAISSAAGYSFQYDIANSKLKVFQQANKYTVSVNPASHGAVASVNTDVTVTGALTTDRVVLVPAIALEAGIAVQSAVVSAADTVRIRTTNASAGVIDPAAANWDIYLSNQTGAGKEVLSTTDLSALTGVVAFATGA